MQKAMFLSLTLVAVALAGCADEPPSGSFTATTPAADYTVAGVSVDSQPPQNEYPGENETACDADQVGEMDPTGEYPFGCENAQSTVALTPDGGATLPLVDNTTGYTLFVMEDEEEFELGALEHHGNGHYDFPAQTYEGQDFSSATEVQLRYGATVIATAPGQGGDFALATGLEEISASANFTGADITVTTSGVPTDTPLVAWLVDVDESGTKTHGPQFILSSSGETSYTLTEEEGLVGDYEEFHVHVGASHINIAVAPIPSGSDE